MFFLFLLSGRTAHTDSLCQSVDYDKVDWDDQWDPDLDREEEERWFDEEEESAAIDDA